jgi:hypothetical protein
MDRLEEWRGSLVEKLQTLDKELEAKYDGEEFVRLPDAELDWKFDAWRRLQKLLYCPPTPQ